MSPSSNSLSELGPAEIRLAPKVLPLISMPSRLRTLKSRVDFPTELAVNLRAKREQSLRADVVRTGQMMYDRGWIAANDGNISIRLDHAHILITPTGMCKARMDPDDLLVCDNDGNKITGKRERSSEMAMHLAVYKVRPDVHSVVHAHPPLSTGFAVAGRAMNLGLMPELIISLGSVPLADYGLPGTTALVDGMVPFIPKYDAILLANHGAVCYGKSVDEAYARMETLEHLARITLVAELLGGPKVLPRCEIQKLFDARERYGVRTPNRFEPGSPLAAEDLPDQDVKIQTTRRELLMVFEEALSRHSGIDPTRDRVQTASNKQ